MSQIWWKISCFGPKNDLNTRESQETHSSEKTPEDRWNFKTTDNSLTETGVCVFFLCFLWFITYRHGVYWGCNPLTDHLLSKFANWNLEILESILSDDFADLVSRTWMKTPRKLNSNFVPKNRQGPKKETNHLPFASFFRSRCYYVS